MLPKHIRVKHCKKTPLFTNDGKNPAFVRIKVEGWDRLGEDNMITYMNRLCENKLGDKWFVGKDGYFYYTEVLEPTEKTDALFDQIVIPTTVTNGFDGSYDLVVTAEAVQAQGSKSKLGRCSEHDS